VPWVTNVTGDAVDDASRMVELLARQLSSPVRWTQSMRVFAARSPAPIFEVGPGSVLGWLMKRIVDGAEVTSLSRCDALPAA
jgi:[acyl-carrier-protein] S-malonyltransferase